MFIASLHLLYVLWDYMFENVLWDYMFEKLI